MSTNFAWENKANKPKGYLRNMWRFQRARSCYPELFDCKEEWSWIALRSSKGKTGERIFHCDISELYCFAQLFYSALSTAIIYFTVMSKGIKIGTLNAQRTLLVPESFNLNRKASETWSLQHKDMKSVAESGVETRGQWLTCVVPGFHPRSPDLHSLGSVRPLSFFLKILF